MVENSDWDSHPVGWSVAYRLGWTSLIDPDSGIMRDGRDLGWVAKPILREGMGRTVSISLYCNASLLKATRDLRPRVVERPRSKYKGRAGLAGDKTCTGSAIQKGLHPIILGFSHHPSIPVKGLEPGY